MSRRFASDARGIGSGGTLASESIMIIWEGLSVLLFAKSLI